MIENLVIFIDINVNLFMYIKEIKILVIINGKHCVKINTINS